MNADIQLIGINKKFDIEPLSFSAQLFQLSVTFMDVLQPMQGVLAWIKKLVVGLRLILGRSRYQLFKLPVIFTFMKFFPTTELLITLHGLQILVVSWMRLFLTAKVFLGVDYSILIPLVQKFFCVPATSSCTAIIANRV